MSDDNDSNVVNLHRREDNSEPVPTPPDTDSLFLSRASGNASGEGEQESFIDIPDVTQPMSPEEALASGSVTGTSLHEESGDDEDDGEEAAPRRSIADHIGDWLEHRINAARERHDAGMPLRHAEVERKVAHLKARTDRDVALAKQNGKLRTAQEEARANRSSGNTNSNKAPGSGKGTDKGSGKPPGPGSPSSRNNAGGKGPGGNRPGGGSPSKPPPGGKNSPDKKPSPNGGRGPGGGKNDGNPGKGGGKGPGKGGNGPGGQQNPPGGKGGRSTPDSGGKNGGKNPAGGGKKEKLPKNGGKDAPRGRDGGSLKPPGKDPAGGGGKKKPKDTSPKNSPGGKDGSPKNDRMKGTEDKKRPWSSKPPDDNSAKPSPKSLAGGRRQVPRVDLTKDRTKDRGKANSGDGRQAPRVDLTKDRTKDRGKANGRKPPAGKSDQDPRKGPKSPSDGPKAAPGGKGAEGNRKSREKPSDGSREEKRKKAHNDSVWDSIWDAIHFGRDRDRERQRASSHDSGFDQAPKDPENGQPVSPEDVGLTAEWLGRRPRRNSGPPAAIAEAPRGLPSAPEPHATRPGTSKPDPAAKTSPQPTPPEGEKPVDLEKAQPTAAGEKALAAQPDTDAPSPDRHSSTRSRQAGLAAQHQTDITYDEYLVGMANLASEAAADESEAERLVEHMKALASYLRKMAISLGNDHNLSTELVDMIEDGADGAEDMRGDVIKAAEDCSTGVEAALLVAQDVAGVYGEDFDAMEEGDLEYASAAAHHE